MARIPCSSAGSMLAATTAKVRLVELLQLKASVRQRCALCYIMPPTAGRQLLCGCDRLTFIIAVQQTSCCAVSSLSMHFNLTQLFCCHLLALHRFASTYQGKYSVAVPDAAAFYPSSNYMDDVAFNALWLYMRTGEAKYKAEGLAWYMKHYNQEEGKGVWNNFDWDSNSWGAALLLTR